MKKLVLLLITLFFCFPIICNANDTISYNNAKIKFNIDETKWHETTLAKTKEYKDREWTCKCGTIITGTSDIYGKLSKKERGGLSRENYNYDNLLVDDDSAISLLDGFENTYSTKNWEYKEYKMKFVHFSGTNTQNGLDIDYDIYLTINNGFIFMFQYLKPPDHDIYDINGKYVGKYNYGDCENPISEIVASAENTIKKKESSISDISLGSTLSFILGILITLICYELYPFIRIILMKHDYTKEEAKKMVLWNSIVVGGGFLILTSLIYGASGNSGSWSAGPAMLYYFINSGIWVSRFNSKKENNIKNNNSRNRNENKLEKNVKSEGTKTTIGEIKTKKSTKEEFVCDNCGCVVDVSAKECPHCGEKFDLEEEKEKMQQTKKKNNSEKSTSDIDKKFSDLNKLKELLDKDIITKEEFENEKKKILKD